MASPSSDAVGAALRAQPLFKGCDQELVQQLADEATIWSPGKGHEIPVQDGMPLLVVLSGALQICVGGGPAATAGRGTVIGFSGLLGLFSVAAASRSSNRVSSIVSAVDGEPLEEEEDAEEAERTEDPNPGRNSLRQEFDLPDWSLYSKRAVRDGVLNLSPHTLDFDKLHSSDKHSAHSAGLRMEILDAISFQRALSPGQEKKNCCHLACITLEQIKDVFVGTESEAIFETARRSAVAKYKALTHLGAFPGVPPEVIWMLAVHSETMIFEKGDIILKEGVCGPPESMVIIESGSADVEMVMFDRQILEARSCRIAKLLPGAILGDVCFVESWVARPTSVVARERVQVLHISSRALLEVMACYPGMASIYMSRSRDTSVVLQRSLTRPADVLAGMKLFYGLEPNFIRVLANIAERKMNFLGDVVKEEGSTDRTLRLQEFGKVRAETEAEGCMAITDVGTVLGEQMFLGRREHSQATFRVATPIAVMLWIAQHHFENLLENNPSEAAYFRTLEETDGGTAAVKHKAEDLQLFRGCGRSFTQDIGSYIGRRAYKPGQAIVVQKAADGGSLFIMTGGRAAVVINSETKEELTTGDVFGELLLLGLVLRRAATVSAITYCTCLEMPKKAFMKALDRHPEETEHFEQLTRLHGAKVAQVMGTWPFLTKATDRLLYYVNLNATRESTPVGKWESREGVPIPTDMAFLIVSGEIYLSENSGRRQLLKEGSCFGEHILIGLPTSTLTIEPKTACELQMMNRQTFERMMAECPDEREATVQGILDEMAIKAEVKLGVARGDSEILKRSSIFRATSQEFVDTIRPRMYATLFKADQYMTDEHQLADCMFIIVRGNAAVRGPAGEEDSILRFKAGTSCCESAVLGTCSYFPYAVQAQSLCLALALSRTEFEAALAKFPHEKQMFAKLTEDEDSQDMLFSLPRVMKINHLLFTSSSIDFLRKMCEFADEVYYAPGETIIIRGESCAVGKTVMYVLLSGIAIVKLSFGDEVAQIRAGQMIGEGGALGITDKRSTEICAHKDTLVRCIRLQGTSIKKAIDFHPEDCEELEATFRKRSQQNAQAEGKRREWLQSRVLPILRQCQLFSEFSMKLINKIAEPLLKTSFPEGQDLCTVGDSADSMILLVDGEVDLKSKSGKVVGTVGRGAVIGELALLGLFPFRTATVTATKPTDTVFVKSWNFQKMLQGSGAAQEHVEKQDKEKRAQVVRGVPMAALPVTASADDVCVRAIALHSTRYILAPGEEWSVMPEAPGGPHNWVFVRGRAVLLIGPEDHPVNPIMTLGVGGTGLLPETLPVRFGARVVAVSPVEAFRTSCLDMLLTVNSVKSWPSWFRRFQSLEKQVTEHLQTKLIRSKAVIDMVGLHKVPIQLRTSRPVTAQNCEQLPATELTHSTPTLPRPVSRSELPPMQRPASQASLRPALKRPMSQASAALFPAPGQHRHADARKHLQSSQKRRDKAWKKDIEKVRFGPQGLQA